MVRQQEKGPHRRLDDMRREEDRRLAEREQVTNPEEEVHKCSRPMKEVWGSVSRPIGEQCGSVSRPISEQCGSVNQPIMYANSAILCDLFSVVVKFHG